MKKDFLILLLVTILLILIASLPVLFPSQTYMDAIKVSKGVTW
jgi:hypothetical protein